MTVPFLDTNILLRHLLQDDPVQSPRSTAYLLAIEQGHQKVRMTDAVILETVFVLYRGYQQPKQKVAEAVLKLIELPGMTLPGKRHFRKVFELFVTLNISFANAYHTVMMAQWGITDIVTFDPDFNAVSEVHPIEP